MATFLELEIQLRHAERHLFLNRRSGVPERQLARLRARVATLRALLRDASINRLCAAQSPGEC